MDRRKGSKNPRTPKLSIHPEGIKTGLLGKMGVVLPIRSKPTDLFGLKRKRGHGGRREGAGRKPVCHEESYKDFRGVKDRMDCIERMERFDERKKAVECDWDDYEDKLRHLRNKRRNRKRKSLDHLVPDRRCPNCGEVRPNLGSWVILRGRLKRGDIDPGIDAGKMKEFSLLDNKHVICKSCHQAIVCSRVGRGRKGSKTGEGEEVVMEQVNREDIQIFTQTERFHVSGRMLSIVRKEMKMSQQEFAKRMGWSRSYQNQLEQGTVVSVSRDVVQKMIKKLRALNFETKDLQLFGDML